MKLENRMQVIVLWMVFLVGFTTHTLLAVMPVFFGGDVAIPDAAGSMPASMGWMTLSFFLIPLLLIVGILFSRATWCRFTNLVFAGLFALLNIFHLYEHAVESPVEWTQVVLLAWVLIFSLIQCGVSFRWVWETPGHGSGGRNQDGERERPT